MRRRSLTTTPRRSQAAGAMAAVDVPDTVSEGGKSRTERRQRRVNK